MRLGKIGMSLAQKTSAWVKAVGKNSILQTKPINFKSKEFMLPMEGKNGGKIVRYIRDGKLIGNIEYVVNTSSALKGYPDYYLNGSEILPSIYIRWLKAKHCGTELMQVACRDAKRLTNGRMFLSAQCIDGKTSPDAFYYKLGFRKVCSKENEIIKEYIKRGEEIPPNIFTDEMFLPSENIEQLLKYKRRS